MKFELVPDIGCIGLVSLLYKSDEEEYPELLANLSDEEIDELYMTLRKWFRDV